MLRHPLLREYLSKSEKNFAVLPDYAAMEAYKGDTLVTIYNSMELLSEFPSQVIVLKTTGVVCGLKGRGSGIQKRLIDESQSREFGLYCRMLASAKNGHLGYQRQLLDKGKDATKQLERMLDDAATLPEGISDIANSYTKEERAILRTGGQYTDAMIARLMKSVVRMTVQLLEGHPNVRRWPDQKELLNLFIFRTSLCAYLLALDWISVGGAAGVKTERLRNDIVDVNFAAYATYFDGLLSNDEKVQRMHVLARRLLGM